MRTERQSSTRRFEAGELGLAIGAVTLWSFIFVVYLVALAA